MAKMTTSLELNEMHPSGGVTVSRERVRARLGARLEARRQLNLLKRLNVSSHQSLISDIGEIGAQIETQNARLVEELREATEREEKVKRELDLTKLELDTLSTQVPKLQKRFQKSFRELRSKAQKRGKELEQYISLSKQQEAQLSKLRKSAAQESRRHADEVQELKLKHVQELYIAKKVSSMRGIGGSE